jgi:uncharacterized protein involved in outer membrane biogenesis
MSLRLKPVPAQIGSPDPNPESVSESMRARRPRRRHLFIAIAFILLLVAALVLPPLINISRYQRQISASLAAALGHPVEVSGIKLQLLPRPAVQIANFVVDSTPGYSAEPILQCSSVTAAFRIMSLWRGRLEIARISLDEPSLNLERGPNGQWNFASVLLQASRTQQAPTGRTTARGQNRFPYIEASNARINFKHGSEKLPFSFMDADVSIWLENPDEWQLRFAAQPMRTDINVSLADAGLVQVSGSVHRASSTNELPLNLQAEWRGAPLGQVTRMLVAHDLGWRGDASVTAHITGVPNALALQLSAAASDFHRETFEPTRPLNLHVTCTATYRHWQGSIDGIHCLSPVGNGNLALTGAMRQIHAADPEPDLKLLVTHVPADEVLDLVRHTRGRLNSDITLSGSIDGQLAYARQPLPAGTHTAPGLRTTAGGALAATDLVLRGDNMEQLLPDLRFVVQPPAPSPAPSTTQPTAQPVALVLEPTQIGLGGPEPLLANVRLTRQGYQLHYTGSGLLQHLLPLAHAFSVVPGAFQGLQGNGAAAYNLTVQGDWLLPLVNVDQATQFSDVSGTIAVHNADFQPSYLAEPVHIATATATISPAELRWNGVTATLGTTRFTGSLRTPLPCTAPCVRHFDLTAAAVNFSTLEASLQGQDEGVVQDLINRVRSRSQDWPLLDGTVHIAHLGLGQIEIANASADLALHDGNLEVRSLDGRTLGGTLHATGAVDLASTPGYDAAVQLRHISAPELAQLLKEHWGPGQVDIASDLTMRGATASDLSGSAKGAVRWNWTSGALPQLTSTPLHRFDRWSGNGRVAKGAITISHSEVTANNATALVTGTIGSDRALDLKVASPPPAGTPEQETATAATTTAATTTAATTTMTGTLAAPVVTTQ